MRVGIAASQLKGTEDWRGASYEVKQLVAASAKRNLEVLPLPLHLLQFHFPREQSAEILIEGAPLGHLDMLIVRRTGNYLDSAQLLTSIVVATGTSTLDPPERFALGGASKLLTTASRHIRRVGSTTLIAMDADSLRSVEQQVSAMLTTGPVIAKPSAGAHGDGISVINSIDDLERLVADFHGPLLLQPLEAIEAEYRVMLLDRVPIGIALKQSIDGGPANAARGGKFTAVDDQDAVDSLAEFVESASPPSGLVGMDVAATADGYFVIEENFSPEWKALDAALGQITAEIIVERMVDGAMR